MKSREMFGAVSHNIPFLKEGLAILLLAVAAGGGYFGYSLYVQRTEQQAFAALYDVMEAYQEAEQKALQRDPKDKKAISLEEIWEDPQTFVDLGYKANKSSHLAPFFLTYKAKIAQQTGASHEQVYEYIVDAKRLVKKSSPFAGLIEIECAKMLLDFSDASKQQQGKDLLHAIARNPQNTAYLEAWYILGVQALLNNKKDEAIAAFKTVTKACDEQKLFTSTWYTLAQEKLDALV